MSFVSNASDGRRRQEEASEESDSIWVPFPTIHDVLKSFRNVEEVRPDLVLIKLSHIALTALEIAGTLRTHGPHFQRRQN
jgi:hypothetical protein